MPTVLKTSFRSHPSHAQPVQTAQVAKPAKIVPAELPYPTTANPVQSATATQAPKEPSLSGFVSRAHKPVTPTMHGPKPVQGRPFLLKKRSVATTKTTTAMAKATIVTQTVRAVKRAKPKSATPAQKAQRTSVLALQGSSLAKMTRPGDLAKAKSFPKTKKCAVTLPTMTATANQTWKKPPVVTAR